MFLVYNTFKSVIAQETQVAKLLPLAKSEGSEETAVASTVFIYEPSREEILNQLLPKNRNNFV